MLFFALLLFLLDAFNDLENDYRYLEQKMKGYIYKYTFPDGRVYIGQTRRLKNRDWEHFGKMGKTNPRLWDAYIQYGKKPDFEIIETIEIAREQDLVEKLNELETKYIQEYQSSNPEYGLNIARRGNVPIPRDKVLENEFRRMWTSRAEQWYPVLECIKNKIFKTHEPLTEEEMVFYETYLIDENVAFVDGLRKHEFNINDLKSNSDDALFFMDQTICCAEYIYRISTWEQINRYIEQNKEQILAENKPEPYIVQMDKAGSIICEYSSRSEIKEKMQLSNLTNIFNCIEGKQKSAYGYIWRYKKDVDNDTNKQLSFDL